MKASGRTISSTALASSHTPMERFTKATLPTTKRKEKEREINSLTYPNGKVYKGDFSNDRPHGNGTISHRDGTTLTGMWTLGKMDAVTELKNKP